MRGPALRLVAVALLALGLPGTAARADGDAATDALLRSAETAPDPRAVRTAAETVLETAPRDRAALRALLVAVGRLADADLLDDAIERARAAADAALSIPLGGALLRRARLETPADPDRLREAVRLLTPAEAPDGRPTDALDLAHARHLLADVAGARRAYERALDGSEDLAERAVRGVASLSGDDDARLAPVLADLAARRPACGAVIRARADLVERTQGPAAAVALLEGAPHDAPRTAVALARRLRAVERHGDAEALERRALATAGDDLAVLDAVERLWRAERPVASFGDVGRLAADADALIARVDADPGRAMAYRNDFAFRFRDVVASFAWRGEGRTQGLAEGAPKEARALLDRVVRLYDEAVARIPSGAAAEPFERRWFYAGLLNDAALMRHYWRDVADPERAQELYLRAFELTDGAYVDTYDYNLQYLLGFERPGQEELWFRLARRAAEAILKEAPDGGFEPDAGKREAARRDAEALARLLDARAGRR